MQNPVQPDFLPFAPGERTSESRQCHSGSDNEGQSVRMSCRALRRFPSEQVPQKCFSVPQSFFEGFIHFRSAFIGLVDQEKINIIGLQLIQRLFNPRFCFLAGRIGTVYFGCEKEFFSGNSTFFDCTSDNILIFIHLGCIDQPLTKIQRSQDALFSRFPADIPGAKADHGHPNVII